MPYIARRNSTNAHLYDFFPSLPLLENFLAENITWAISLLGALIIVFYRMFTSILEIKLELAKKVIEADFDKKLKQFDNDLRDLEIEVASLKRKG